MRRLASVIELRAGMADEYRRLHAGVWPEVVTTLRAAGVTNYSVFQRDGLLFSYQEYIGSDHSADTARIAADPITQRWWRLTQPCQRPLGTAAEGQWWAPAEEVFHFD